MSQRKTDRDYRTPRSIPLIVRNILHTVYTSMPGVIEEYNKEKRTATVRGASKIHQWRYASRHEAPTSI